MLVASLGDVMLDVLVDVPEGLVPDDDTPAAIRLLPGGQAANVAAWVRAAGGAARVFGPRGLDGPGRLVTDALRASGVEVHGPPVQRSGSVVSWLTAGARSLASDPGSSSWLSDVRPGPWLSGVDWLVVSGYALLRSPRPELLVDVAAAARAQGASVAVDLASASMIRSYGPTAFLSLWQALEPAVVLANKAEWAATHENDPRRSRSERSEHRNPGPPAPFGAGGRCVLVLKRGAEGCAFVIDGVADERRPRPGPAVDVTGAGDALAAGFLLGGPDLAMELAARCVARVGAQPGAAEGEPTVDPAEA